MNQPDNPNSEIIFSRQNDEWMAQPPRSGMVINQKYQIVELLGKGGMGVVYKVQHLLLGTDKFFALKVVKACYSRNSLFRERFLREVQIAMELSHEHILPIRDYGEIENGTQYFTMDFSNGVPLKVILKQQQRLSEPRALAIIKQVLSALKSAHQKGIIHRDLKPANIMIETRFDKDYVLLLDFGLAKILNANSDVTQEFFGTFEYMSPEQASQQSLDQRSDLYSVGLILYEMLTGHLPFERNNPMAILMARVATPPPPAREFNPDISSGVENIIKKALQRDPENRFASAEEFSKAIELHQLDCQWPTCGGNNERSFTVDFALRSLYYSNSIQISSNPRQIVCSSDKVFISTDNGQLWCIDSEKTYWCIRGNNPIVMTPAWHDNLLFVGNTHGTFYCLRPGSSLFARPITKWKLRTQLPFALSPLVNDDHVFFACRTGKIYCYTLNGDLVWEKFAPGAICAALANDGIYLAFANHILARLHQEHGGEIWALPIEIGKINALALGTAGVYIAVGGLLVLRGRESGEPIACWNSGMDGIAAIAVSRDRVYVLAKNRIDSTREHILADSPTLRNSKLVALSLHGGEFQEIASLPLNSDCLAPLLFGEDCVCLVSSGTMPGIHLLTTDLQQKNVFYLLSKNIPLVAPAVCGRYLVIPCNDGHIDFFKMI